MSRPHTIWVVDDDPELRQLLGTYLGEQGYEVRCLSDGAQLLARLDFQRPDLVVLDLMMPGEDGLTVLRRLRDNADDLPVVMLTARGRPWTGSSAWSRAPTTTWPNRSCPGSSPPASKP